MSGALGAGALDQRVQHERSVERSDGAGGLIVTWHALGVFWAHVTPSAARLVTRAAKDTVQQSYQLVARRQSDIRAGDRLTWRGHVLKVVTVVPTDATAIFIQMNCEELM